MTCEVCGRRNRRVLDRLVLWFRPTDLRWFRAHLCLYCAQWAWHSTSGKVNPVGLRD